MLVLSWFVLLLYWVEMFLLLGFIFSCVVFGGSWVWGERVKYH